MPTVIADALLVMDEAIARAAATGLGLRVMGIVGILVLAKRRGLIPSLKAACNVYAVLAAFAPAHNFSTKRYGWLESLLDFGIVERVSIFRRRRPLFAII